ncbi:MAG: zinc dependent phospholipase C family protein [Alphaproteobacteria bacterium]|nr:zinc dependent phospholipase C family protein [Alphaproteobacteria bacterium]
MPRDLSHIIISKQIMENAEGDMQKCIKDNPVAFEMGAICPDAFLFGTNPILSTMIHGGKGHDIRNIVLTMMDNVMEEKDPKIKAEKQAFTYGYLTHVASDQEFHPFVYSLSGCKRDNSSDEEKNVINARHRAVETWLDVELLDKEGINIKDYHPTLKFLKNMSQVRRMGSFFVDSYKKTFPEAQNVGSSFKTGFAVQLALGKITRNQTLGNSLRRLDKILGGRLASTVAGFYRDDVEVPKIIKDVENFKHPVTGDNIQATIEDMTLSSVRRGIKFLRAAEHYMQTGYKDRFVERVPNICLDTGVQATKLSDIKPEKPASLKELLGQKMRDFMARSPIKRMKSGAEAESQRSKIMAKSLSNYQR